MADAAKGFWASLGELFGQAVESTRQEVVERGWFGRETTNQQPQPGGQDTASRPNNLNQTAVNMNLQADNAIVQVNNGRATLTHKADFDEQWRVKPPSQDHDQASGQDRDQGIDR